MTECPKAFTVLWLESNGSLRPCTDKLKHFENHFSSLKKMKSPSTSRHQIWKQLNKTSWWLQLPGLKDNGILYATSHVQTRTIEWENTLIWHILSYFFTPQGKDNYNYSTPCHDTKNSLPKRDTKPTFHLSILTLTPRKWLLILKMFDLAENQTPWNLLWTSTSCCLFPPIFVQVISE